MSTPDIGLASRSVVVLPMIVISSVSSYESRPDANQPASRDG
jgi:hypothetical protein